MSRSIAHEASAERPRRFMGWRDLVLTPVILLLHLAAAFFIARAFSSGVMEVVCFFVALQALTLVSLAFLRVIYPLREGRHLLSRDPAAFYAWTIQSFLCITNLSLFYNSGLCPPLLRQVFYQLLGARMGSGIISIGGKIADPSLVVLRRGAMLGEDSLVLPHAVGRQDGEDFLLLARVVVGRDAIVGARAVLMPGVEIGEGAMVKALSLVPAFTKIGPGEVWGGIPARRLGLRREEPAT